MVVIDLDDLRTVYQEARIGEAFDEAASHAELLNDEASRVKAIVINLTEFTPGFVNDVHADELEAKFVELANFDNIVNPDKFIVTVDNHTDVTELSNVSDANESGVVNEERTLDDVGHNLEIGRINKGGGGLR